MLTQTNHKYKGCLIIGAPYKCEATYCKEGVLRLKYLIFKDGKYLVSRDFTIHTVSEAKKEIDRHIN